MYSPRMLRVLSWICTRENSWYALWAAISLKPLLDVLANCWSHATSKYTPFACTTFAESQLEWKLLFFGKNIIRIRMWKNFFLEWKWFFFGKIFTRIRIWKNFFVFCWREIKYIGFLLSSFLEYFCNNFCKFLYSFQT